MPKKKLKPKPKKKTKAKPKTKKKKRATGKKVVKALAKAAGLKGKKAKAIVKKALANEIQPDSSEFAEIYFALPVHGSLFVGSFSSWVGPTLEEFWNRITEFIAVEIQFWCEDRKLEDDHASLERPHFYRIDKSTGQLERLNQLEQFEALVANPQNQTYSYAYFSEVPDEPTLREVHERYRQIEPSAPFEALKLS